MVGQRALSEGPSPMRDSPAAGARTPAFGAPARAIGGASTWSSRCAGQSEVEGNENDSAGIFSTHSDSPRASNRQTPLAPAVSFDSPLTLTKPSSLRAQHDGGATPSFFAMSAIAPMDIGDSPMGGKTPQRTASSGSLITTPRHPGLAGTPEGFAEQHVATAPSILKAAEQAMWDRIAVQEAQDAEDAAGQFEEEACMLLSEARAELFTLNARWKQAETVAEERSAQ
ncbi:hypothetical protein T484DRAFT_1851032, partial [Baffinella frigidus]